MDTYRKAIKLAEHYKAIGETRICLSGDDENKPWHLVTKCEPGGSHRLDISTSVRFYAFHPESGLNFDWSFDIEPYDANGKSHYEIDARGCSDVLAKLPSGAAQAFRKYLAECAEKVAARGDEYFKLYQRQHVDADTLRKLSHAE